MKKSLQLFVEQLESRTVLSANVAGLLAGSALSSYSIDGSGNNLTHAEWGKAGIDLLRLAAAEYSDGVSAPAGADRPSARVISNTLADQAGQETPNSRMLSAMIYAWGQFIDHDMDLTMPGTTETMQIAVPAGDPFFDPAGTGTQVIATSRSTFDPATGVDATQPRQQVNNITAWLDASMIYGSDAATAASLRTFEGGKLKTSAGNLLPVNADGSFLAGDIRVNENPELTSLHTLFMREHNAWADKIATANPELTDEQVFQQARAIVSAEVQSITFNEWLPAVLGKGAIDRYTGYQSQANPGIANEFSTAAFRFGHSLLGDDIEFLDNFGQPIAEEVALRDAFFNSSLVTDNGIDSILKYLASDLASELDTKVVDGVRNFLFGAPGAGGFDLASLNIERGRDHGLADYNTVREAYGLSRVTSFADISANPEVQAKLEQLYGSVDNIDLWVGALAEDHVPGASVGPTLKAIISDQFERLRDGDRFWFENVYSGKSLHMLENTTLADVIRRNTDLSNLQRDVFFFRAGIGGTVFADGNRNGRLNRGERGLEGRTVELVNADTGEVVASTLTNAHGEYRFDVSDGLGVGRYQVREVLPDGWVQTTPAGRIIPITRGDIFITDLNIGNAREQAGLPPQIDGVRHRGGADRRMLPAALNLDQATLPPPVNGQRGRSEMPSALGLDQPPPLPAQAPPANGQNGRIETPPAAFRPDQPPPLAAQAPPATGQNNRTEMPPAAFGLDQPPLSTQAPPANGQNGRTETPLAPASTPAPGMAPVSPQTRQLFGQLRQELLRQAREVLRADQFRAFAQGLNLSERDGDASPRRP